MRKIKAKLLMSLLLLCLILSNLYGCGRNTEKHTLTMMFPTELRAEDCERFVHALRAKFPEIRFDVEFIDGDNAALYQLQRLRNNDAPDVVWYTGVMDKRLASSKLVDLSGYPFMENFDSSILALYDADGHIYQVPGPIAVQSIVVNKTLLTELGATVPSSFDELVTAVKAIHQAYPEIAPLSIGMEKLTATMRYLTAGNESGFQSTPAGKAWKKAYLAGDVSSADGFSEGLDMMARLIDAGAFRPEVNVTMGDANADLMLERKIAMSANMIVPRQVTRIFDAEYRVESGVKYDDEYVLLPFFGVKNGQTGLGLLSHSAWSINKRLEDKGNEDKLANALKVMEYLSTTEAQMALCPNDTYLPALRTIENDRRPDYLKEFWERTEYGVKFFGDCSEYADIEEECINIVWDAMKAGSSEGMKEAFIQTADRLHQDSLTKKDSVGVIQTTLFPEDTMALYRKAMLEASGADFVLASTTGYVNGTRNPYGLCPVKLYKGEVNRLLLSTGVGYKIASIETTTLTGAEVKALLTDGKRVGGGDYEWLGECASFAYSVTGLDVSRDHNGIPTSFQWNGSELEDERTYTVAFLTNDYSADFTNEHNLTDTGVLVVDAVADYIAALHGA